MLPDMLKRDRERTATVSPDRDIRRTIGGMCWRCVSESVPYVMGSVVAVRAYGAKLGRTARASADETAVADSDDAAPARPESAND
jgi:hypothetical protein